MPVLGAEMHVPAEHWTAPAGTISVAMYEVVTGAPRAAAARWRSGVLHTSPATSMLVSPNSHERRPVDSAASTNAARYDADVIRCVIRQPCQAGRPAWPAGPG